MNRRRVLAAMGAGVVSAFGAPVLAQRSGARCGAMTPANIEGPYYLPGAPETAALDGRGLLIRGRVITTSCGPARNGVIEVWQANEEGEYDLQGFRNRGVVRCDADGRYAFRTVRPGHYLNGRRYRPAHIHVKVHADSRPTLTTQLYFSDDPYNASDAWFRDSLVLGDGPTGSGAQGLRGSEKHFTFVV